MTHDNTRAGGLRQAADHLKSLAAKSEQELSRGATGTKAIHLATEAAVLQVMSRDLKDMADEAERCKEAAHADD